MTGLPLVLAGLRVHGPETVLLVDDAHNLDEVSATLVGQVAQERALRLVLVLRSGEPAPDAVTAIWADGEVDRLDLGPLTESSSFRLLRQVLGGAMDSASERALVWASGGNVLWLRHLVEGERAAGRLARDGGVWRWSGPSGLPPALRDLVDAHIGDLTPPQRRVLELLALAEPLGLGLLGDLAGSDAVEDMSQRDLVTVAADGSRWEVRLGHPLYGEAVRSRIGAPRGRRLRGEIAAALGRTGSRRADDGLRRAVLDLGSDSSPDPDLLTSAAVQAAGLGDFALSERLWRAACDAGAGFEARLGLGQMLSHILKIEEADVELARAVDEARSDTDRLRATVTRAIHLRFMAARPEEAVAALDETEARVGRRGGPVLDAVRSTISVAAGRFAEALAYSDSALAAASGEDADVLAGVAITWAVWGGAHARAFTGRGEPVSLLVEQGIAAARRSPETAAMQANLGFCEVVDADLRGDIASAGHRVEWVHGLTGRAFTTLGVVYDGRVALSTGIPSAAVRSIETAAPFLSGYGGGWGVWLQAMITQGHGMLGDAASARRALAATEDARHPAISLLDWEVHLARAWTAAAEGAHRDAAWHARRGADEAGRLGMSAVEVLLRQTAVRFGDRGQAGRLTRLARDLGTPRARLAAEHARAVSRADPVGLLAVSRDLEEAGMVLEAADAAAHGAAFARDAGDLEAAAAGEARARALSRQGDDVSTPAVREASAPVAVSSREREVATLAAAGLSNREIAERLGVSRRTVESHVYRACARLGLADRAAFVAVVVGSSHGSEMP